ncbi:hypothetical protein V2J09_022413 [Rumex salicifolius]
MVFIAKVDRVRSCNGVVLCSTWSGNGLEYCEDTIDCIKDEDKEDYLCGGIGEVDLDMPCVILSREAFVSEKSSSSNLGSSRKSEKKMWFRKLCSLSCVMEEKQMQIEGSDSLLGKKRPQRVKVRQCSKKHNEISSLYLSQDFQAHEAPILVMKFSPDGEFLASAREDRIVRVWIWEISNCHVVNWSDIKDIVTVVIYRPDGQSSMRLSCGLNYGLLPFLYYIRYYLNLLLDGQICIRSKKKSSGKRIIGFQVFIGC